MIQGQVYTDGQVSALTRLADGPIGTEGIDPRTPRALVERELCTESGGKLTLTPTGVSVVTELTGRAPKLVRAVAEKAPPTKAEKKPTVRGGGRPKRHGAAKAKRERPAAPTSDAITYDGDNPVLAELVRVRAELSARVAALDSAIETMAALA
jgi:hypothetical protein